MGGGQDVQGYQRQLEQAIQEKGLHKFYGPGTPGAQKIPQIAARAGQQVDRLCQAWRIQREIATDIVRLALYDVVVFIDDSGSMSFEEGGERIKDLQLIMQRVAFAATLFDDDGIDVRFMNDDQIPLNMLSGIRNEQQVEQLLANKRYKGLTPFGTELRKKVIDGMLVPSLRSGQMQKPLLIISITDGQPAGENQNALVETVRYAVDNARRSPYVSYIVPSRDIHLANSYDVSRAKVQSPSNSRKSATTPRPPSSLPSLTMIQWSAAKSTARPTTRTSRRRWRRRSRRSISRRTCG